MPSRGARTANNLFPDQSEAAPERCLVAYIDGGARGNPGPSGYGVVIEDESGKKIAALSEYLGHQTNNFAEYQALIAALAYAIQHGHKALKVVSDSELLVRQIKGIYKVKNPTLQDLHARARQMIGQLDCFAIGHVLRGKNREADRLANAAMDKGTGRVARAPSPANNPGAQQELNGIVREGRVELLGGTLPDGTRVQVRIKH